VLLFALSAGAVAGPVLHFVIPAKSRKAGREPGTRHQMTSLESRWIPDLARLGGLVRNDGFGDMLHGLRREKGFFRSYVDRRFRNPLFGILSSILCLLPAAICLLNFYALYATDH